MKEKKYFHDKWFASILLLIERKKINSAISELDVYLDSYPYDISARTAYATLLIDRGEIEKVEELLNNTVLTTKANDRNICELLKLKIKLLCCQRKYDECYKLFIENDVFLNKYFDNYYSVLTFLRSKLGLSVDIDEQLQSYTIKQLISYSEERAIEHINKHIDNFDFKEGSSFSSDFCLEEVYNELRNVLPIKNVSHMYSGVFLNVYIFKYENCGREFRKNIDYIKVISVQDTNQIITMFPYDNNKYNLPVVDYDFKCKKVVDYEPKVKRLSQIDKFNQRYRKVVD